LFKPCTKFILTVNHFLNGSPACVGFAGVSFDVPCPRRPLAWCGLTGEYAARARPRRPLAGVGLRDRFLTCPAVGWCGFLRESIIFEEAAKSRLAHSGERLLKFEVKGKMRFRIRVQRQGHIYLPKAVREALSHELKIIPGERVAVLCSSDASKGEILASLQLIIEEIKRFMGGN
jgi:bifunctional DNA-binding transcriptional regulator/antitoxin component of YhaV-PrlF toxin-antitoxin module